MKNPKLDDRLRTMVRQYGLTQVQKTLREIASSENSVGRSEDTGDSSGMVADSPKKTRTNISAMEYVEAMQLGSEIRPALIELATRFERKSFLPTMGDIRYFCQVYRMDNPVSRSRARSFPMIFRFIASMEPREIRRIVDGKMFSGPSRLGPIADAIRARSNLKDKGRMSTSSKHT